MEKICLDTDVIVDFLRGDKTIVKNTVLRRQGRDMYDLKFAFSDYGWSKNGRLFLLS